MALVVLVTAAVAVTGPVQTARADCVFPFTPTTYEDVKNRKLYLDAIELASYNMLFPGDPYFGLPDLEFGPRSDRRTQPGKIPPTLLKAVAWIESGITQGATDLPFGAIGPALVSFDCGHGVTQVTTGMTVPLGENGRGTPEQALVATHFAYNIARGAWILADKWNRAPEERPITGIDTNGIPQVVENWYYAVWSYNGFTGPGANRSNHPMDPIYGQWPRSPYSCGPQGDGKAHNRGNYPYQELVFGCSGSPPIVEGTPLWQPLPLTLPDLSNDAWRTPLRLANFIFPYVNMDMPTPQPFHVDQTPQPAASVRERVLGSPKLSLSATDVKVGFAPGSGSTVQTVDITNTGTGVLAWYAIPSEAWLVVKPYTGVAAGGELKCNQGSPCDRVGRLEISVDAARAPPGRRQVSVRVQVLGTAQAMVINVEVSQVIRLGVPGVVRN